MGAMERPRITESAVDGIVGSGPIFVTLLSSLDEESRIQHNGRAMKRFKPVHGFLLVVLFMGAVLGVDYAVSGGFGYTDFARVSPDEQGLVRIDISQLEARQVRFFRFLNAGNQEVKFFVGRDAEGVVQVAFDASTTDYKRKRGFRHEGDWMVNNKCDTAVRLSEVNAGGGGCKPVVLEHRLTQNELVLAETDILSGWRYFR